MILTSSDRLVGHGSARLSQRVSSRPVSCVVLLEEEVVFAQHISKRAGNGFR
jgi:hypothetical protein